MPWNVFGITGSSCTRIPLVQATRLVGQAPSLATLRDALQRSEPPRDWPQSSDTFDRFFPARETAKPGVDAVRDWADIAAAASEAAGRADGPDGLVVWNAGLALRELSVN